MLTDGENKWFSYSSEQTYSFDRHLCPGGKLEFSGLWKLGKNGSSEDAKALVLKLHSVEESHSWIFMTLYTHPKLHVGSRRKKHNDWGHYFFDSEFPYGKLVHGYVKCEETHLDLYFMNKFLFKIPDYKTYHGPFNKVSVIQYNGFFELKSLTMSEGM